MKQNNTNTEDYNGGDEEHKVRPTKKKGKQTNKYKQQTTAATTNVWNYDKKMRPFRFGFGVNHRWMRSHAFSFNLVKTVCEYVSEWMSDCVLGGDFFRFLSRRFMCVSLESNDILQLFISFTHLTVPSLQWDDRKRCNFFLVPSI